MNEFINQPSGYFRIETLDINGNIRDFYEDHNMIMTPASTTMAEIFAKINSQNNTGINRFALGTMGHVIPNILVPKTQIEGFVNTRDRLFCEPGSTATNPTNIGDIIPVVNLNDIFFLNSSAHPAGYYIYTKPRTTNYNVTEAKIANDWTLVDANNPTKLPYIYNIFFDLPGTKINAPNSGDAALNIVEDDAGSGSTVTVLQNNNSVIFEFNIAAAAANSQNINTSTFTEAALYANGRLFSMKTFKAKIKDGTVSLRIIWKITF